MGASVSYIPGDLGIHEPLEDIGHYLDAWFSILVVRARNHDDLLYLANSMHAPVINARTNFNHPCEILGDLQFVRKHRGAIDGLRVVFVGEVTNLCMSWFEAAVRLPVSVTQVAPSGYIADTLLLEQLNSRAVGEIRVSSDLDPLLQDVDLIYTDCWPKADSGTDSQKIQELFFPFQITIHHLQSLKRGALFLPCPPVTRGQEVSPDAMDSPLCLNYEAKAHLLHTQNAVLEFVWNA
jgi:Ornithine carbamoyltransferase